MADQHRPPDPSPTLVPEPFEVHQQRLARERRAQQRAQQEVRRKRVAQLRLQQFLTEQEIADVLTRAQIPCTAMQVSRDLRWLKDAEREAFELFDVVAYFADTLSVYRGIEALAFRDYELSDARVQGGGFVKSGNLRIALMARMEQTRILALAGQLSPGKVGAALARARGDDANTALVSGDEIAGMLSAIGLTPEGDLVPEGERRSA